LGTDWGEYIYRVPADHVWESIEEEVVHVIWDHSCGEVGKKVATWRETTCPKCLQLGYKRWPKNKIINGRMKELNVPLAAEPEQPEKMKPIKIPNMLNERERNEWIAMVTDRVNLLTEQAEGK
jgi:hypothetical protein